MLDRLAADQDQEPRRQQQTADGRAGRKIGR
jgi:hypothetical protein